MTYEPGAPRIASKGLAAATQIMREVESELRDEVLAQGTRSKALHFPNLGLPNHLYVERNFHSIVLLAVFRGMGLRPDHVRAYAGLLHALRGVLDSAENILHRRNGGPVSVAIDDAPVMSNLLSMMMQQSLMLPRLEVVMWGRAKARQAWGALVDELYGIGEECRQAAAVEHVQTPSQLLDRVHRHRDARMLLLAFVVPSLAEVAYARELALARSGVLRIGVFLLLLDDLATFRSAIELRCHNMLRSWLVHGSSLSERDVTSADDAELRALSVQQLAQPELVYPEATGEVLVAAVAFALAGLADLSAAGLDLEGSDPRDLIAEMLRLHGGAHLWPLYLSASGAVDAGRLESFVRALA